VDRRNRGSPSARSSGPFTRRRSLLQACSLGCSPDLSFNQFWFNPIYAPRSGCVSLYSPCSLRQPLRLLSSISMVQIQTRQAVPCRGMATSADFFSRSRPPSGIYPSAWTARRYSASHLVRVVAALTLQLRPIAHDSAQMYAAAIGMIAHFAGCDVG
jgi:hypothetical protein